MKDSDLENFSEAWMTAYEMTGNCKMPSERAVSMAFDVLKDFELGAILNALSAHVRDPKSGQFQPKPADIVRYLEGTPDDAAMEAWGKVDQAIRRVGYGPVLVFDDPKIHVVLQEMGGFAQFGSCTEQDLVFLRQTFCKRYAGVRQLPTEYPRRIAGWHTDGQVRMIGDPDRCKQVLEGGSDNTLAITSAAEAATALVEDMRAGGAS